MARRRKILAVDDSRMNLAILEELLSDEFDLRCVETGGDAITVAKDWEPDAILLDVMLPDIDGLTVCTRLRHDPQLRHSVIIFVTAKALEMERTAGIAAGAKAYLAKPFDGDDLLDLLESLGLKTERRALFVSELHTIRVATLTTYQATETRWIHFEASRKRIVGIV